MGVVYQAWQLRAKRRVALKIIRARTHASPEERMRFRIEAEAIARFQHPHIVQLYEVGEHDGLPFFSLELCEGGPLSRRLDGKPLPAREAAALVETLARAMHYAHSRGVIHRDLKPANVLTSWEASKRRRSNGSAAHTAPEDHRLRTRQVPRRQQRVEPLRRPTRHAGVHGPGAG